MQRPLKLDNFVFIQNQFSFFWSKTRLFILIFIFWPLRKFTEARFASMDQLPVIKYLNQISFEYTYSAQDVHLMEQRMCLTSVSSAQKQCIYINTALKNVVSVEKKDEFNFGKSPINTRNIMQMKPITITTRMSSVVCLLRAGKILRLNNEISEYHKHLS